MQRLTEALHLRDGEITAAKREADGRIHYGGPWVSAASALPLTADGIRLQPVARLVAAAVRRPHRLAALIALLLRTPTERVFLSETTTGQILREYFNQRAMGVVPRKRFFRGILSCRKTTRFTWGDATVKLSEGISGEPRPAGSAAKL
jgi:hypothetical protein